MTQQVALLYTALWLIACALALVVAAWMRGRVELLTLPYWHFLLRPWKLVTFAIAGAGMVVVAPYTGDWSWTYVTGAYMSLLAFATAP